MRENLALAAAVPWAALPQVSFDFSTEPGNYVAENPGLPGK